MMRHLLKCGAAAIALAALAACGKPVGTPTPKVAASSNSASIVHKDPTMSQAITTPSGLQYLDTEVGTGDEAKVGQQVAVHYTGWLYNNGEQGQKFDSSKDRGQPFVFGLGQGMVIKGWDEGVAGMKVGGKRTLIIPSELGYGARGAGGVIPPNATLKFDVELLGVR